MRTLDELPNDIGIGFPVSHQGSSSPVLACRAKAWAPSALKPAAALAKCGESCRAMAENQPCVPMHAVFGKPRRQGTREAGLDVIDLCFLGLHSLPLLDTSGDVGKADSIHRLTGSVDAKLDEPASAPKSIGYGVQTEMVSFLPNRLRGAMRHRRLAARNRRAYVPVPFQVDRRLRRRAWDHSLFTTEMKRRAPDTSVPRYIPT